MSRAISLLALLAIASSLTSASAQAPATPELKVTRIVQNGQAVTSTADVTLLGLDGSTLQEGVQQGSALPNDVRVEVPAQETVTLSYDTGMATLGAESSVTFAHTGTVESAMVSSGHASFANVPDSDPVSAAHGIYTVRHGTAFWINVTSDRIIVTCTNGTIDVEHVVSTSGGNGASHKPAIGYVDRIDGISAAGRSTLTYTVSGETTPDISVAEDQTGASGGDADAEYDLGARYYSGDDMPQDYATALHWFRLAASQGNADAQNRLGYMYELGQGVAQSYPTALHWYRLAAGQGDADAENNIGQLYASGNGVRMNDTTALHWYQLAAAQGDADAEDNIGLVYDDNARTQAQYAPAVHWFELAAAHGSVDALGNLGDLYSNGHGVPRDPAKAQYWYQREAAQRTPP